jgi:hypothetical protein
MHRVRITARIGTGWSLVVSFLRYILITMVLPLGPCSSSLTLRSRALYSIRLYLKNGEYRNI